MLATLFQKYSRNASIYRKRILRSLFHVSVSVSLSVSAHPKSDKSGTKVEKRWAYSSRQYQYMHSLIRKQLPYKWLS